MRSLIALLLIIIVNYIKSDQKVMDKHEKLFPQFRQKMEEISSDQIPDLDDESSDNFVSFLIDNVKELFFPADNSTMIITHEQGAGDSVSLLDMFRTSTMSSNISLNNTSIANNSDLPFLRQKGDFGNYTKWSSFNETDKELLLHLLKSLKPVKEKLKKDRLLPFRRTCIFCDNVLNENCNDPRFKLAPSINCQREDDVCYSQHTPFGIINRGCFNINHDLTFFVCACNLCNYISISEMPYIFSDKRDWVENVIELSGATRLRDSIFKDMSCLRCEVNGTSKRRNIVDDANCLEGNIAALPTQTCTSDEICAVKAIRSKGYVWRGCVSEPLYNYWWTFCGHDWCNYDTIVSTYDLLF